MSRRKNRRKRTRKSDKVFLKLLNPNPNIEENTIFAKNDYYINDTFSKKLFSKNVPYKFLKVNEHFYKITPFSNERPIIITTNLFNKIFN